MQDYIYTHVLSANKMLQTFIQKNLIYYIQLEAS